MSTAESQKESFKEKAAHESKEIAIVFAYLAFLFCALATYSMLLLEKFHISYFIYGAALLNAFVITKIILIGEALHLGRKQEAKPLLVSSVYKAFLFGLLVFGFHVVEEVGKRLIHGKDTVGAFHEVRLDDLMGRSVIIFCTFIPFFAFRELGRVLGKGKLRDLFMKAREARKAEG
jgi:hypothetical protein